MHSHVYMKTFSIPPPGPVSPTHPTPHLLSSHRVRCSPRVHEDLSDVAHMAGPYQQVLMNAQADAAHMCMKTCQMQRPVSDAGAQTSDTVSHM